MSTIQFSVMSFPDPIGMFYLLATPEALLACSHLVAKDKKDRILSLYKHEEISLKQAYPLVQMTHKLLLNYLTTPSKTSFHELQSLPLQLEGTLFQKNVWQEIQKIPFGNSISYGKIAEIIHKPLAMRAVGLATGRNPFSIIIPCHRVLGANDKITGYAGGLAKKRWLLHKENISYNN